MFTGCSVNHTGQIQPSYNQTELFETDNGDEKQNTEKDISEDDAEKEIFTGIDAEEESIEAGSQSVNNRCMYGENYFCADPDTGVIYYVNYGDDNYLYRLDGNKKELVLDKFVSCINILDGMLYFIYAEEQEEYSPLIQESYCGRLYSYNLNTKELKCLSKEKLRWIGLTEDGIYGHFGFEFQEYPEMIYFYGFDENKWEPVFDGNKKSRAYHIFYKGYYLKENYNKKSEYTGTVWKRKKDGKEIPFLGEKEKIWGGEFLSGDHLYIRMYNPQDELQEPYLCMINLSNGEKYHYKTEEGNVCKVLSSVEIENVFYMPSNNNITIYTGDVYSEMLETKEVKNGHVYERLYTDGKRLFALYRSGSSSFGMAELLISEEGVEEIEIGGRK